jgi:D-sedoheptulose 7-phosphate isomerase
MSRPKTHAARIRADAAGGRRPALRDPLSARVDDGSRTLHRPPVSSYLERHVEALRRLDVASIERAIDLVRDAWRRGRTVFVCGNGGSALTAAHYVMDWSKAAYAATGRPLRAVCLSDNLGLLTAYANDASYADVYAAQLAHQLAGGDLVIVVSGSGNSPNVVRAVEYANAHGATTLAVCGCDGGAVRRVAQHAVWVASNDMQICEDLHLSFGHVVMKALCGGPTEH